MTYRGPCQYLLLKYGVIKFDSDRYEQFDLIYVYLSIGFPAFTKYRKFL